MELTTLLLIGFMIVLACASSRTSNKVQPCWSEDWTGWRKLFYLAGLIAALLIVMNPDFALLGFLGDAAFFDLLVFTLSLQFQVAALRAMRSVRDAARKALPSRMHRLKFEFALTSWTLVLTAIWLSEFAKSWTDRTPPA